MKHIKLEVGKTYRSRRGEEVKIVEKDNATDYPFRGSDDLWYTESGKFAVYVEKSAFDLIAEVPETRHTLTIPDGVKELTVQQVGNRIVVEMVPEDKGPKPGDIVFEDGRIMIVKKYPNLYHAMIHGNPDYLHINGSYGIPFTSATLRLATAEEAQLLLDALKKAGKRWNPDTLKIEELTERERIREWLKNEGHTVNGGLTSVIEQYVKHKEQKMSKTLLKE